MWSRTFAQRLEAWAVLRQQCQDISPELALQKINAWWFTSPWQPYHLHWDDLPTWPDPWQLLDDNIYCSLARGLGIMYTIAMMDRSDIQDSVLAEFASDNLVLVNNKKYILNWDSTTIVNISPGTQNPKHQVTQKQIQLRIQ